MTILKTQPILLSKQGEVLAEKVTFKRQDGSIGVKTINKAPSKTQQHYKDEVDLNKIVKKHHMSRSDLLRLEANRIYADFTDVPKDYAQAYEKVIHAQETFNALPSEIRSRFKNDIPSIIKFVSDPKNKQEAIEIGLLKQPQVVKPSLAEEIAVAIKKNDSLESKPK